MIPIDWVYFFYLSIKGVVKIPIYTLNEPKFVIENDKFVTIRPVELFSASPTWNVSLLNETLIEYYTSTFIEPEYDYSIGESYLNSLLNYTFCSYFCEFISIS